MAEEAENIQVSNKITGTVTDRKEAPKRDMIGVKLLLVRKNDKGENEFLIMHRIPEKYPGATAHWDFPGGRVNNEKFHDTARRELDEEIQLNLPERFPIEYVARQQIITPNGKSVTRVTCAVPYSEEYGIPKIPENGEHDELLWATTNQMERMQDFDLYLKELITQGKLDKISF